MDLVKQRPDRVELRATKDDNSEVLVLTREAAALRSVELAAEGWVVETVELPGEGLTDGRGAWSRWAAFRDRYTELRERTWRAARQNERLRELTLQQMEEARAVGRDVRPDAGNDATSRGRGGRSSLVRSAASGGRLRVTDSKN